MNYKGGWQHDNVAKVNSGYANGNLWLSPLLVYHLLDDSSVGRAEELAEFSVAVFQFLPFPAATSDLNMKDDIPQYSSNMVSEHPNSSLFLHPEYCTTMQS